MKYYKHIIANWAIIISSLAGVWELGMNEVTTLSSPPSIYPTKQEIPEKSQSPHLITYLSKNQLKIFKGFSFITGHDHFRMALYSFYISFPQKTPKDFNFILFLTFASHFKSAYILQHEPSHYVLPYIKLPKSRVKLQSAKFQTASSGEHSPGVVQKPLLSTRWGPHRQHPTSASRYNLQAPAPTSLK